MKSIIKSLSYRGHEVKCNIDVAFQPNRFTSHEFNKWFLKEAVKTAISMVVWEMEKEIVRTINGPYRIYVKEVTLRHECLKMRVNQKGAVKLHRNKKIKVLIKYFDESSWSIKTAEGSARIDHSTSMGYMDVNDVEVKVK